MSKLFLTTSFVVLLSAPVFAGQRCASPAQDQWMSKADLTAAFVEKGYDVRNVKIENGCYEVYALDTNKARVELYVDPVTGKVLGKDGDD